MQARDTVSPEIQKQLDEIRHQEDTSSTSVPWYLQMWNYCIMPAVAIKNALQQIPSFLFPDNNNPGDREILPWLGYADWPDWVQSFVRFVPVISLFYQWKHTIQSFSDFGKAENKNFEAYKKPFVHFLTTLGETVLTVGIYIGGLAALINYGPYILMGIFGLNALNCLANCALNLYTAFTAKNKLLRNEYLFNAAKSLVGIVTNGFAVVASYFMGMKLSDAIARVQDDPFGALAEVSDAFVKGLTYTTAVTAGAMAGLVMGTVRANQETYTGIKEAVKALYNKPVETLKKAVSYAWMSFKHNPFVIIPAAINFTMRAAALTLAPVQLVGYGIIQVGKKIFNAASNVISKLVSKEQLTQEEPLLPAEMRQKEIRECQEEKQKLEERIQQKVTQLDKELGVAANDEKLKPGSDDFKKLPEIVQRRIAKKVFLTSLHTNLNSPQKDSVVAIEAKLKEHCPSLHCAFFKKEAESKQIAREYEMLEKRMAAPAA